MNSAWFNQAIYLSRILPAAEYMKGKINLHRWAHEEATYFRPKRKTWLDLIGDLHLIELNSPISLEYYQPKRILLMKKKQFE